MFFTPQSKSFTLQLMYIPQQDQTIQRFYTDAINSVVFGTPVSYLQKYPFIHNYTIIVQTEDQLLQLLYQTVSKNIDKMTKIVELLTENNVDQKVTPYLAKIIANKFPDIRNALIRRQISRGSPCLLDNNWRIINIKTTNWNTKTNKILLNLTLIIEQSNNIQNPIQQIPLQMNIHEAGSLLTKLKNIKQALKI